MNFVLYAIPFFFLLIAIELIAERVRGTQYYRVNDAINSLMAGVLSQVFGLIKKMIPFTVYYWVFEHFQLTQLPNNIWVWAFAFISYDFFYYWNHRLGHEVNLFWAAHVVHHSSEEYNLSTALRQTSGSFLNWIFFIPMAFVGVDPLLLISVGSLNLIYQFWVHTRHIPKLGWFEWFFVTPSNHRVHHAQNQIYLDKNYGGVFIIWDRIFGTFQEELDNQKPIYGVRKPLSSWNPIWANLQVYTQLIKDSWRAKRWQDKCSIWFKRTGWRPKDVEQTFPLMQTDLNKFTKYDPALSSRQKVFAVAMFMVLIGLGLVSLFFGHLLSTASFASLITVVLLLSVSIGFCLEKRKWANTFAASTLAITLLLLGLIYIPYWVYLSLTTISIVTLALLALCFFDKTPRLRSDK
ncbi:sterol desaturase family protein [Glaciecola petra]|uniref:Sterol desaturase family protein n=1 Tax=Glaciecola petra TaxID=3075602 RepID=A0ABU2ZSH5_9ALTE|nr:sterol desaturase family protein [Aestuariibacter sp. P117]MDT0595590.1 sterol desaturase family protein [Aestuariibacter sp. P117]